MEPDAPSGDVARPEADEIGPAGESAGSPTRSLDWAAIAQGLLAGLAIASMVAVIGGVVDRMDLADETRNRLDPFLLVLLLVAYALAGAVAARREPRPALHGVLAALGALACWLPIRIAIWVVKPHGHGLVSGSDPVFTWPSLAWQVVIATVFGMIGAWLGNRHLARAAEPPPSV